MLNEKWIAHVSLLFVTVIWGARFVVVQHALSLVQPFTFNAIRLLIARFILLNIQVIYTNERLSPTTLIGCACILLTMILVELPGRQKEESAQAA